MEQIGLMFQSEFYCSYLCIFQITIDKQKVMDLLFIFKIRISV